MDKLFFDGFMPLLRIMVAVPIVYVAVIVFVRMSGKRTTGQMNGFDWIVTVAMGSLVASAISSRSVPLADGLFAIALMLLLQFLVTGAVRRSARLARLVKSEPRLLVRNGRCLPDALAAERMTEGEILSAVRGQGVASMDDVAAVVLETDATISVIPRTMHKNDSPLAVLNDVVGENGEMLSRQ
ncbi:MAG: DUF421 domain-containing protein [Rhodothermales bacterium]|nr:DUF421 domain-containing protein [Rhodothermales bacterium]